MTSTRKYTWKPDRLDPRDIKYTTTQNSIPTQVDLRGPLMPPVLDQGNLGSCTANASASNFEYLLRKQSLPAFAPSRLFIYYYERVIDGTVSTDSGANVRDSMTTLSKQGVCDEQEWKYNINNFRFKPHIACYNAAVKNKITSYQSIDNTNIALIKDCLAAGFPFVFGFQVYESFESAQVAATGHVPMPASNEQLLGGHCTMAVGYDDINQWAIAKNSWSASWGDGGYFYLPYSYLTNPKMASSFWTPRLVI